jgi:hypothetical protein
MRHPTAYSGLTLSAVSHSGLLSHNLGSLVGILLRGANLILVMVTDITSTAIRVFLVALGGMRLNPLGTSATNWPIVPAPDDR